MLINSALFLFCFLPISLFVYYVLFRKVGIRARNVILLFISFAFLLIMEPIFALVLAALTIWNTSAVKKIKQNGKKKMYGRIAANGAILLLYTFLPDGLALFSVSCFYERIPLAPLIYFCHVVALFLWAYRDESGQRVSGSVMMLYLLFFPVMTAGPLMDFKNFVKQAKSREIGMSQITAGATDFVFGLSKVVILGQIMSYAAKTVFQNAPGITVSFAGLAMICFALELYYEFSGLCQMAKGAAKMFGFDLPESFASPVTENSLTSFFTGFNRSISVYVSDVLMLNQQPNRLSILWNAVAFACLFTAFFGISWNLLLMVLVITLVLLAEQRLLYHMTTKSKVANHVLYYLIFFPVAAICLILLGTKTPQAAADFFGMILGFVPQTENTTSGMMFLQEYGIYYLFGLVGLFPIADFCRKRLTKLPTLQHWLKTLWLTALLICCVLFFTVSNYLPYFAQ